MQQARTSKSSSQLDATNATNHVLPEPPKILKLRLTGKEEFDRDFIEVDVPPKRLTFRGLIEVVCEEFSVDPRGIVKIRKLPNTKLRRDAEVRRLQDYQELEVEMIDA